jgi:adenine-specific DNA-methyltransferase
MDYEIQNEDGSVSVPSENGRRGIWRWSKQKYEWGLKNGFIVKRKNDQGSWTIYTKQYFKVDNNGDPITRSLPPSALIEKYSSTGATKQLTSLLGGTKIFDYPKPVQLLDLLQSWVLTENDLVLDFFSGSGTTGQAIYEANARDGKNRKFILVQLPEPVIEGSEAHKAGFETIADISRERLNRAADKVGETLGSAGLDLGYRTFRLKESGFAQWGIAAATSQSALEQHLFNLRDNATDDESQVSLLTEVLLKLGYSLSETIESVQISELDVMSVGDGLVLAYMNQRIKPSLGQLRDLLSKSPAKFIILEDAFNGDDELKTNLAQLCKSQNVELWTA